MKSVYATSDGEVSEKLSQKTSIFDSGLLLLGSYVISLLVSSFFHELGHGLAMASVSINFRLVLNPFSSSMAMPLSPIPSNVLVYVASAGTIFELITGTLFVTIFWRWRNPKLLPLLMIGPSSYLKSAGYFMVGTSLVPDGDTALLVAMGIPDIVIQALGIFMLVIGAVLLLLMFPLFGLSITDSFKRIFTILFLGLVIHGFGMILFALLVNPLELYIGVANVFSMILTTTILTGVFIRSGTFFDRLSYTELSSLERKSILQIAGVALALIIFELIFFN